MAHSSEQRFWCQGVLRYVLAFLCVCSVGYIVGPTLFWHLKEKSRAQASCPSCVCNCFYETDFLLPPGLANSTYSDCGKNDPDVNEELEKDIVALLSEEIALQKIVSNDTLERSWALTMDTKRASLHYQKEAEKCNAGVETCEEARERAEAELREELKLTALWEKRARELWWQDSEREFT
ncbi:uncharacterized protein LOC111316079 [Durio zibethinus]|uniref:Uncharacterized protein LOC111316079 n=1 Tax=Durio zibethinus TaxID=66656 RepID=A0A6P6B9C4_DURZI|nr:uncharacterized protein LOC111316079 [Durio zibethinus]